MGRPRTCTEPVPDLYLAVPASRRALPHGPRMECSATRGSPADENQQASDESLGEVWWPVRRLPCQHPGPGARTGRKRQETPRISALLALHAHLAVAAPTRRARAPGRPVATHPASGHCSRVQGALSGSNRTEPPGMAGCPRQGSVRGPQPASSARRLSQTPLGAATALLASRWYLAVPALRACIAPWCIRANTATRPNSRVSSLQRRPWSDPLSAGIVTHPRREGRRVLGRVKGSLAPLAGYAALDPPCARSGDLRLRGPGHQDDPRNG
jgi:hypothetical protein